MIFSGSHRWHTCVEYKHFDNLYRKQQSCPCLILSSKLRRWIELRIKNQYGESLGFSFRTGLWFPQWFCLCEVSETNVWLSFNFLAIFTVKCNDSVSFSFLFPCFLFYSLSVKDQIASFQLKEIVVVLNQVFRVCVYFIAWLRPSLNYNRFGVLMQLIVWTLNMNYVRKEKSNSVSFSIWCRHFQTIFLGLPIENSVKGVVTSLDSINGRWIQTLLRE